MIPDYLAPFFSFFGVSTGEMVLELELDELELEHSRLSSAHATFLQKVKIEIYERKFFLLLLVSGMKEPLQEEPPGNLSI